jgi:hypothetical protein
MGFVPRVSEEFNRSVAVLPRVARSERLRDNGIHLPEGKRHRVSARCRLLCLADSPLCHCQAFRLSNRVLLYGLRVQRDDGEVSSIRADESPQETVARP